MYSDSISLNEVHNIIEAFRKMYYITHDGLKDKNENLDLYFKKAKEFDTGHFAFRIDEKGFLQFGTPYEDYAKFTMHGRYKPSEYGKRNEAFLLAMKNETVRILCKTNMFTRYIDFSI